MVSQNLIRVIPIQDEASHWYVIPYDRREEFNSDNEDYEMSASREFDKKWGKYRVGGCLSQAILYGK
jgi:hypothetical protein